MQAAEWQRLGDTEAGRSHKIDSNTLMGTFKGVFLPTLQSVFGIVMFIRLPWITGMAGVGMTLVIIGMSVMCTLLTTLSMSAIATNGVVRAGGAYYMVSRSLGKEFGVSVGILLYLALSASFALFTAGAVELLVTQVAPQMSTGRLENDLRLYGSALLIVMALIALLGMRNITRVSIGFISFVFIAIITIFVGLFASNRPGLSLKEITGFPGNLQANFGPGYDQPDLNGELNPQSMNFFRLFAIFFPSVTGVMAGSNRSGLLRRPDKSIPRGTLAAVGVSTLTYVLFVLLFGTVATGAFLRTKTPFNGLHVAVVSAPVQLLTLIGCIISAIGAGLQCVAGAPRLLYAVAKDDTIPVLRPLRVSRKGEPLRALLITFLLAECIVLVGSFDVIAPISTMLYLTCYAFINFSTTLLSYLQYPNWRPSWRFHHWSVSLLGALLCIVYMFLINWIFALIALVLVAALYKYSQYIGAQVEWGDGIFALNLSIAQRNLLALERHRRTHAKNWRYLFVLLGTSFNTY
jgi:amino acid transporter